MNALYAPTLCACYSLQLMNTVRGSSRVSPRRGEELLAAGLSEPTWLSPWLLSAEGEMVPYLSRLHPKVVRWKIFMLRRALLAVVSKDARRGRFSADRGTDGAHKLL